MPNIIKALTWGRDKAQATVLGMVNRVASTPEQESQESTQPQALLRSDCGRTTGDARRCSSVSKHVLQWPNHM